MDCQLANRRGGCELSILLLLLCIAQHMWAQPSEWKKLSKQYPDETAIFLTRNKTITLEAKGDSVKATAAVEERILFLKDRMGSTSDMRIFGSHFQEINDVMAGTKIWEKSKYHDVPLKGLTRQMDDDGEVFFDDSYFYHLSFPAGGAGDQAYWSYTENFRDARFLPAFYFQDYLRQTSGKLQMRVPSNVAIKWRVLNDAQETIRFRQYKQDDYQIYEWSVEDQPAVQRDEQSPKYSYFTPMVVVHVTAVNRGQQVVPVLNDLQDLHAWYYQTIKQLQEAPSAEMADALHTMVRPDDTELDVVSKVFYWVQNNVRYIAFEDGMRGLVPHKPGYVFEKRYGDCKDMASLIVGMLQSAGIKSYYTWIGTRDIPYRYTEFPSPLVDNHMIATYIAPDSTFYFLDGTSNYTDIGLPSAMIQGKEAFIVVDDQHYLVRRVPHIDGSINRKVDTVRLQYNKGSLSGKGTAEFTGYQKVFASYDFNKTVAQRQKENVTRWLKKGSNKYSINDYHIQNLDAHAKPLLVTYDFTIADYATAIGDEIYLNLNLEKAYNNQTLLPERKAPFKNEYAFSMYSVYIFELPEGYEVEYLPPDASHQSDVLKFNVAYVQTDDAVRLTYQLQNESLLVMPDQFEEWNTAVEKLSESYKESVVLKRKTP